MQPTAQHAIRAAQNIHRWGRYAARRYTERRGVPASLYRLARQLQALDKLKQNTINDLLAHGWSCDLSAKQIQQEIKAAGFYISIEEIKQDGARRHA